MAMLRSLDLFSGVGGMTLALRDFACPIAYCDIDPNAHVVLQDTMQRGLLPTAPICDDVRSLGRAWLRRHGMRTRVDMLTAGFPCQGFSISGKKEGFEHGHSGLFVEILRLVDELRCSNVFMENSPNILNLGMDVLVSEFAHKRGFNLRWCVLGACDVGAPHRRYRWFCLATRSGSDVKVNKNKKSYQPCGPGWSREPKRTDCGHQHADKTRMSLLGNALVPEVARRAFCTLITLPKESQSPAWKGTGYPKWGSVTGRSISKFSPPKALVARKRRRGIVLRSDLYEHPTPARNRLEILTRVHRDYWATPRAYGGWVSNALTQRTARDLCTQIRYEERTEDRGCWASAGFVEWLMGYPKDWTAALRRTRFMPTAAP